METILYTTRGSTDLPLRGITFATEGVGEFMTSVMNIDNQDFVGKMEGFAIRGIRGGFYFWPLRCSTDVMTGAAKNTQQRCSELRASIRQVITEKLRELFSN